MQAQPGDKVKLETTEGIFEGTLLPRPELLSNDITIIKLKTGYNIGIETKKIKKTTILETYKAPLAKKQAAKHNPELPTIAILSTGGTISSRIDYRTGGVYADYTAEDFVNMCPELQQIANIKASKIMSIMSEDATTTDWKTMAEAAVKELSHVDGIVITHGTDTMHYSAAALSFLIKDLNKPVIITGAQRSIDRGSSDAFMNMVCAVTAAAKWNGAEVAICMHATMNDDYCTLLRGTKVRKMHTSRRDAFHAINDEPLAHVKTNGTIEITNENYRKRNDAKPSVRKISNQVALIQVHPDMDLGIIEYHLKQKIKGIVIAATALGHIPITQKSLGPAIAKAAKAGVTTVLCSQTVYGRVHPYTYTNLRKVSMGLGVTYLADMLPETAYAKLCVALTEKDPVEFMKQNIAGEYTMRELDDSFLL
ncbi:Glu-tRNA(Gln) amidotransferase subunit GatD [Candidatus Woesearchaeota archaeon]|nr:Glu-tRNA(Gln) amidotransferase subunit GatD [Candidatus Woesearchaeota archaeon]